MHITHSCGHQAIRLYLFYDHWDSIFAWCPYLLPPWPINQGKAGAWQETLVSSGDPSPGQGPPPPAQAGHLWPRVGDPGAEILVSLALIIPQGSGAGCVNPETRAVSIRGDPHWGWQPWPAFHAFSFYLVTCCHSVNNLEFFSRGFLPCSFSTEDNQGGDVGQQSHSFKCLKHNLLQMGNSTHPGCIKPY